MARSLTDPFSSPTGGAAAPASALEAAGVSVRGASARLMLLVALSAGLVVGGLLTAAFAGPGPADVELARLLRAMVLIKGAIAAVAATLIFRRLGSGVGLRPALGYATGLGMTCAALGWLWGLSGLFIGSVLFYAGLILCFAVASRDPSLLGGLARSPR
jgi:hypothetical protein